jgi:hypothetical protein
MMPAQAGIHLALLSLVIPAKAGIQCLFFGSSFRRKPESSAFALARHSGESRNPAPSLWLVIPAQAGIHRDLALSFCSTSRAELPLGLRPSGSLSLLVPLVQRK